MTSNSTYMYLKTVLRTNISKNIMKMRGPFWSTKLLHSYTEKNDRRQDSWKSMTVSFNLRVAIALLSQFYSYEVVLFNQFRSCHISLQLFSSGKTVIDLWCSHGVILCCLVIVDIYLNCLLLSCKISNIFNIKIYLNRPQQYAVITVRGWMDKMK